jgi:ATP adenylyltransferase
MTRGDPTLPPGALWPAMVHRTETALRRGALQPIETSHGFVAQGGMRFVVRMAANLVRKDRVVARPAGDPGPPRPAGANADARDVAGVAPGCAPSDPFLPHDPDLFVADVSSSHVALLNKFNVLPHHLLIVTRAFEAQECLLNRADLAALAICLREVDGLGFYNGGRVAGASQAHKHLQLVPLPLVAEGPRVPLEALLGSPAASRCMSSDPIGTIQGLPYRHAFTRLARPLFAEPARATAELERPYLAMLDALGIGAVEARDGPRQSAPYNLLVTRDWLLLVPRRRESFLGVPVNALGFAGSLFVRDAAQLATVERRGPMTILAGVAVTGR